MANLEEKGDVEMDAESRQNTARLLRFAAKKPVSVFTDLDKTSCVEGCREYAAENESETGKKGCFMQPDVWQKVQNCCFLNQNIYRLCGIIIMFLKTKYALSDEYLTL